MTENKQQPGNEDEAEFLKTAIHDLNNRVGVVLATAELLQMEMGEGKSRTRCETIEKKALEAREILKRLSDRYFD